MAKFGQMFTNNITIRPIRAKSTDGTTSHGDTSYDTLFGQNLSHGLGDLQTKFGQRRIKNLLIVLGCQDSMKSLHDDHIPHAQNS